MLINLATSAFKKASWATSIQTGRYMYPLANNTRNAGPVTANAPITYETKRNAIQKIHEELSMADQPRYSLGKMAQLLGHMFW